MQGDYHIASDARNGHRNGVCIFQGYWVLFFGMYVCIIWMAVKAMSLIVIQIGSLSFGYVVLPSTFSGILSSPRKLTSLRSKQPCTVTEVAKNVHKRTFILQPGFTLLWTYCFHWLFAAFPSSKIPMVLLACGGKLHISTIEEYTIIITEQGFKISTMICICLQLDQLSSGWKSFSPRNSHAIHCVRSQYLATITTYEIRTIFHRFYVPFWVISIVLMCMLILAYCYIRKSVSSYDVPQAHSVVMYMHNGFIVRIHMMIFHRSKSMKGSTTHRLNFRKYDSLCSYFENCLRLGPIA